MITTGVAIFAVGLGFLIQGVGWLRVADRFLAEYERRGRTRSEKEKKP